MERGMETELPPDESDDLLEKADALLRRHQRQPFPQPRTAATPPPVEPAAPFAEVSADELFVEESIREDASPDDIPTLTDVVETASAASAEIAPPFALPDDLEARLYHELESRIAPQLTAAFQHALAGLLDEARQQIAFAVREHLKRDTQLPATNPREKSGSG